MNGLWFWKEEPYVDPFDPNNWVEPEPCRIYDPDMERYAIVDAWVFPYLVTQTDTHPARYGVRMTRRWYVKDMHESRKGTKLYFVCNSGWRTKAGMFLHVEIMERFGPKRPSRKHTMINHVDGDEWNCLLENLEWSTPLQNRRAESYGKKQGRAWAWKLAHVLGFS